jgi:hypothetical protein
VPRCTTFTGGDRSYRARPVHIRGLVGGVALRLDDKDSTSEYVSYEVCVVRGGAVLFLEVPESEFTEAGFAKIVLRAVAKLDAVIG